MEIFVKKSSAKNKLEVIHELVEYLCKIGYVKDTYEKAIQFRELDFPTGLELQGSYNVAIPHAETEHVIRPAIALAILENSIEWESMEDPDENISVHLVFLLAIKDPKMVVPNLQALTENVFSKPEVVATIRTTNDFENIKTTLHKLITTRLE
ncbi:MAG: PTS sugar transporter subunit IIA [Candidatus Hodarchaeota archaeon]